jgi:hypothetical protein
MVSPSPVLFITLSRALRHDDAIAETMSPFMNQLTRQTPSFVDLFE